MPAESTFHWQDYIQVHVADDTQRQKIERAIEQLAQTPEGRELITKARDNSGSVVEIRTDGKFQVDGRDVDVSNYGTYAFVEPTVSGGYTGKLNLDLQQGISYTAPDGSQVDYNLTRLLSHELYHLADPHHHPEQVYTHVDTMIDSVARRSLEGSKLDAETKDKIAADLAAAMKQELQISPDNKATRHLEIGDLQTKIDTVFYGMPEGMRQSHRENYGIEYPSEGFIDRFKQQAAERYGVKAEDIIIRNPGIDSPLYERHAETGVGSSVALPDDYNPSQGGADLGAPPIPSSGIVASAVPITGNHPVTEQAAVRYEDALGAKYFASPPRADYGNIGTSDHPLSQVPLPSFTCSAENRPTHTTDDTAVMVLGELRTPPQISSASCQEVTGRSK